MLFSRRRSVSYEKLHTQSGYSICNKAAAPKSSLPGLCHSSQLLPNGSSKQTRSPVIVTPDRAVTPDYQVEQDFSSFLTTMGYVFLLMQQHGWSCISPKDAIALFQKHGIELAPKQEEEDQENQAHPDWNTLLELADQPRVQKAAKASAMLLLCRHDANVKLSMPKSQELLHQGVLQYSLDLQQMQLEAAIRYDTIERLTQELKTAQALISEMQNEQKVACPIDKCDDEDDGDFGPMPATKTLTFDSDAN